MMLSDFLRGTKRGFLVVSLRRFRHRQVCLERLEDRIVLNGPGAIPAPHGIVAWYPGDGSVEDLIGGNTGTLVGGAAYTTAGSGMVDQAFNFGSYQAYASIPSTPVINFERNQPFTIEAWVRLTDSPSNYRGDCFFVPWEKGEFDQGGHSYGFALRPGPLHLIDAWIQNRTDTNRIFWRGTNPVDPTGWHHYAMTYDGSSQLSGVGIYVDGERVNNRTYGEDSLSQSILNDDDATLHTHFSTDAPALQIVPGLEDELSLYSRALTAAEIKSIFDAGSAGKIKPQADLAASTIAWNSGESRVDYSYSISGTDLSQATTAALYWSADASFDPNQDTLAFSTATQTARSASPYTVQADRSQLAKAPTGTKYLLAVVDPTNSISESDETNNVAALGLPDLVGTSFHYTVLEDSTRLNGFRVADGPLPFNGHFDINAVVTNSGANAVKAFRVGIYASPDRSITTSDYPIATWEGGALGPGESVGVHLDALRFDQSIQLTGAIYLGMVIDPDATLTELESDRSNNANRGDTIDRVPAQLYDPIPQVIERTGFPSERAAALYLFGQGFSVLPATVGGGWARALQSTQPLTSRFDGASHAASAYRQFATIMKPDATHSTYWVRLVGSLTSPQLNPLTANRFGSAWAAYVADWFKRFGS